MRQALSIPTLGRAAAVAGLALALGGCQGETMAELRAYAEAVKARPGPAVTPVDLGPLGHPPVEYLTDRRDPFAGFEDRNDTVIEEQEPFPDPHPAEELEAYPLDSLRMVGTVTRAGRTYGLVRSPDGLVHRVRAGNYLGHHSGKILAIAETGMSLRETVPDGPTWREREAALALTGAG